MALIRDARLSVSAGLLALGVCSHPALAATPEEGRRFYDAGQFTDAMGVWAELSRQGNAEARFGLGLLSDLGNGVPQDPAAAFYWYKLAADAGLPEAEFNVATMYDSGRGVAQNHETAALWYAKAAARGHHRAQFDLGMLYEQGDGVPRNPAAAAAWLKEAANGGISAAGTRLKGLGGRAGSQPSGRQMAAASLVSPTRNVIVSLTDSNPMVELVWAAPPEPGPVHYEIRVRELGGSTLQTVSTESVDTTAIAIQLPTHRDFYVWNVETVAGDGSRLPSDWGWFSVGQIKQDGQVVESSRGVSDAKR